MGLPAVSADAMILPVLCEAVRFPLPAFHSVFEENRFLRRGLQLLEPGPNLLVSSMPTVTRPAGFVQPFFKLHPIAGIPDPVQIQFSVKAMVDEIERLYLYLIERKRTLTTAN